MTPYIAKIGFDAPDILKKALEKYAKDEGIKPAVVCRKALVKYLKEKGILDKDRNYL